MLRYVTIPMMLTLLASTPLLAQANNNFQHLRDVTNSAGQRRPSPPPPSGTEAGTSSSRSSVGGTINDNRSNTSETVRRLTQ